MNVLVVGYRNSDCELQLNQVVVIKPDIFLNEQNKNEYCLRVYLMENGIEGSFTGYVGREFLSFKECYEFKLAQVIKVYCTSSNSQERQVAEDRNGVCLCRIIN
jgi:hypothetical protein